VHRPTVGAAAGVQENSNVGGCMTKPDWGHGPNAPVLMYTEEEIRTACDRHQPTGTGSSVLPAATNPSQTAEQIIAVLKQARGEDLR